MSSTRMRETSMDIPLDKMNLSFAGCGFLGIYHVGVASCFREYCPTICSNHFSGASVGALVATAMALDLSLGESTSQILKVAIKARSRALGPFHPTFDVNKIITDALDKTLPEDAHERVNGRLHISVTRVSDGKNVILSHFDSKQDLIQAVMCSCFIPCWSGLVPPKFHGVAYMDGGLSDNLPNLDDYTITISPFSGESDICPRDTTFNLLQVHLSNTSFSLTAGNLYRITRILFPPHPEVMSKMCEQGFNDALKFLQRNNKISCLRCVAIQSSFLLSDSEESDIEEDEESEVSNSSSTKDHSYDDCAECQNRREMCDFSCLPVPVVQAIQEATDAVNKGLINWIFKHRPVKILSLLTVPVVLPFDITLVVLIKTWRLVPAIKQELKQSLFNLLGFVTKVVNKVGKRKDHVSAKFSCQLAITEFDYGNESKPSINVKEKVVKKRKTSVYSIPQTLNSQISSMISTNGSGNIQAKPRRYETMPSLLRRNASDNRINSNEPKVKRKSYAGKEEVHKGSLQRSSSTNRQRRKSMIDILNCKPSERVIERMNFGFTVDIPTDNVTCRSRKPSARSQREGQQEGPGDEFLSCHETENVIHALKSLEMNPEEADLEAIEMTNKALILEKEYLNDSSRPSLSDSVRENADAFAQIMNVTSNHEALMKFYYLDEKKRVKVTEIFNIPDEKGESSSLSSSMIKNTFVDNSHTDSRGPKRTYS